VIAILGGLGAACCWAATGFCAQTASRKVGELNAFAWASVIGLLLVLGPLAVSLADHTPSAGTLGALALAGVMNVAGLVAQFYALRIGRVSVVVPITSAEGAVAAIAAAVLGEPLPAIAWASLAAVILGVAVAAWSNPERLETSENRDGSRPVLFAILSALCFGVGLCVQGKAGQTGAIAVAIAPPTVMGVLLVALPLSGARQLRSPRGALPNLVAVAVVELLGFSCYIYGARESIPIAAVLSAQYATIALLVSVVVLRERLVRGQLIGYAAIAIGVAVLAVTG
jgi:drug/metabolite transporter (DMT)-like permease